MFGRRRGIMGRVNLPATGAQGAKGSENRRGRRGRGVEGALGGHGGMNASELFATLESRCLFSFSWTSEEVYLTELVNRARANPAAEAVRYGIDLAAGLTSGELARLAPQEPLAMNASLTEAARSHSLDMAQRDFFDHENPDGHDPTWRAQNAGYMGVAGENIAAGYDDVELVHIAWLESLGHRRNVLSLYDTFDESFHYDEFGPGAAHTAIGPFFDYFTEVFGVPTTPLTSILGVVYNDADSNNFYTIGEGMTNVRIDVALASAPDVVVGTYTTDPAGNYQIAVGAGEYTVTFTNLLNGTQRVASATVGAYNVKVDAQASQFNADADDYADAGDWAHAQLLVNGPAGEASIGGQIAITSDSDLFRYDSTTTALVNLVVVRTSETLNARFSLFGSVGNPISVSIDSGDGNDAFLAVNLVQGQSYYILVSSESGATFGAYNLNVQPQSNLTFNSALGQRLGVASGPSGLIRVTTINPGGDAVLFAGNGDGSWTGVQVQAASGSPAPTSNLATWIDPKDGRTYAAARSAQGLLLYTNISGSLWTYRNLTAELTGTPIPATVSSVVAMVGTDDVVRVAAFLDGGDMVLYQQTGEGESGGYQWSFENIAQDHLAAQSRTMPHFVGDVFGYVTSWNGLNVAGLDDSGNIQVVWWAPGLELWQTDNLSLSTGAPPLVGGLSPYLTPWNGINLSGINADGEVVVTWWVPGFEGNWRQNNLTQEFDGPALTASSVTTYVSSWGGLNVAGLDSNGDLIVYWWAPERTDIGWAITNLSLELPGGVRPVGKLSGHATATGVLNVFGADVDGHVVRFSWQVGGDWMFQDLTASV